MQKVFNVAVDIGRKLPAPAFEVNTNDLKSVKLLITITNGQTLLDLTDTTVRIAIRKPDSHIIFQDCTVKDATGGQVEIILENQAYITPGTHTAEIMCYKGSEVVAVSGTFSYKSTKGIMNDEAVESKSEFTVINKKIEEARKLLEDATEGGVGVDEQARQDIQEVTARLEEVSQQVGGGELNKHFLSPQYIEYFGSFSRFGLGVPSGISKYTGGNYVLTVSGNAGETFVTVQSGTIADAGGRWPCVIENNDGMFDLNQVVSIDGTKINLLEPLKKSISSKRLGNLHDAVEGQHYTELGYFAFAQHFYRMNPRHAERNQYIAQFKSDDTSGNWASNAWFGYAQAHNMKHANGYYRKIGGTSAFMNATNNTHYVEWEQRLDKEKGYFESYIGASDGALIIEFYIYLKMMQNL